MVLRKETGDIPPDFLEFQEVFGDINSPGLFIATKDEDFKPTAIILDGHSTLLLYNSKSKDVTWSAHRDQGSYTYMPDNMYDGAVLFPHTFYFEFNVELADRLIVVAASFGGAGINAIAMPMNGVPPSEIISTLKDRLSSTFTSVMKPVSHTLTTIVGSSLALPETVKKDLVFKLAVLGMTLESMKVLSINELPTEEGEMVEKIYDTPPETTKIIEELRQVKKKSKKKAKKSPDPPPPMRKPKPVPATSMKAKGAPAPPPASSGPPAPGGGGPPGPKAPSPSIPAPSSKPPSAPPKAASKTAPGPSIPAPSASSGSRTAAPIDNMRAQAKKDLARKKKEVLGGVADEVEEKVMDEADDLESLMPTSMKDGKRKVMQKAMTRHTNTSYFSRMLPNRSYLLKVQVASEELTKKASVTSVMSGERASEVVGQFDVTDIKTPVIIRPFYPGCMVIPAEVTVDIASDFNVEFYVTPLTLGKLNARVKFIQNSHEFHSIELPTKVITHRASRLIGYAGLLTSILPGLFAFIVGEDVNAWLDTRFELFLPQLMGFGYLLPAATGAGLIAGGGLWALLRNPRATKTSLAFPR